MNRSFFSNPEELFPVFDEGVLVVLQDAKAAMGTWRTTDCEEGNPFRHEIKIRAQEPLTRPHAPRVTSTIEEIQATLLHELIHAFRYWNGLARGPVPSWQHGDSEYEIAIDAFAYDIIETKPSWVDCIVSELIQRPNCAFVYQAETPFLGYHRDIIRRSLEKISGGLCFGNPGQINILYAAQALDVSLPMKAS